MRPKLAYVAGFLLILILLPVFSAQAHERPGPLRGEFLEPPPDDTEPRTGEDRRVPVAARGIYLTGHTVGEAQWFAALLELVERTELNAMVIDVKDCTGKLTYESSLAHVNQVSASSKRIRDLPAVAAELRRRGIYSIARLVAFQDPVLSHARPDLAVNHVAGGVWREPSGLSWTDPHSREVWDYLLDIAREVAKAGFDEIQFDYVRFPSDGNLKACVYPHADGKTRSEVISSFLGYCRRHLEPMGVYVSADIYGLVPTAADDMGIGQYYEDIIANVDYVCPMVYPSHYALRSYGLPDPDAAPYETVMGTLRDAARRHGDSTAIVRPWLQDFTLGHRYGLDEVRAQIQAVYDSGLEEWILWNAANRYTEGALLPAGSRGDR